MVVIAIRLKVVAVTSIIYDEKRPAQWREGSPSYKLWKEKYYKMVKTCVYWPNSGHIYMLLKSGDMVKCDYVFQQPEVPKLFKTRKVNYGQL